MLNSFGGAVRLSNPTIHASPFRYSSLDSGLAATRNRRPAWFGLMVPWVTIDGSVLQLRGHDPSAHGRDAEFYDLRAQPVQCIGATAPYQVVGEETLPAANVELKQIAADIDVRNYAAEVLSQHYDQEEFQKEAAEFAIRARWEAAAMIGDAGTCESPRPEFDGLTSLVAKGRGTSIAATADQLGDLDRAMTRVVAHNRRVDLMVMNQAAWVRLLKLERATGYRPQFGQHEQLGLRVSWYNGIPICLSDHIPTTDDGCTSVFVMTLGEPNGVFAIVNKEAPGIVYPGSQVPDLPVHSSAGQLYSALVSATDDALVEVRRWRVFDDVTTPTPKTSPTHRSGR